MSDLIRLLPDNVANQIAAGEVVQRPASVVKELLENAVDAGATEIQLIIKEAGRTLIQVIDNGSGMATTEVRMAFERHATSKIRSANDLFDLHTNGFRGEALASIAAVSQVRLRTRVAEEELGVELKIHGGEYISQNFAATNKGSNLEVRNLFYNIPARRKFLKSNSVETRHIIDAFQRVALSYPLIQFSMRHNENELFSLPSGTAEQRSSNLRQRIRGIMGKAINEKLVPINEETDIVSIEGFVTKPSFAKKKRGEQFLFVNDRFIKSSYLHHAVMSAYEGLLQEGYHPTYFLYLKVPPESIDINIHPTKTEVKFDNERDLYAIIRSTVKHSLGQYNVAPSLDFERDASLDTPYAFKNKVPEGSPTITVDKNFNPFSSGGSVNPRQRRQETNLKWEALYLDNQEEKELIHHLDVEAEDISQELFAKKEIETHYHTFQVLGKYIASPIHSGLVLIDQNAAHQRILYEDYLGKVTLEGLGHQQLLFPIRLKLSKNDLEIIRNLEADLKSTGFVIASFEEEAAVIEAIPVSIDEKTVADIFERLVDDVNQEVPDSSFSQIDTITKSLAKSLAIKPGAVLSNQEQEELVNKLFSCKEPNYSPFGKKTCLTLSLNELDALFNK